MSVALESTVLLHSVEAAILAPSSHNTQPWSFVVGEDELELRADRSRRLAVVDPDDRELIISCGAALLNARVAIRRFGRRASVDVYPNPTDPDVVARITLGGRASPTAHDLALFDAIASRRTNRSPFEPRDLSKSAVALLMRAAELERAWFVPLRGELKLQASRLVMDADRIQFRNPSFRGELAQWLRPNIDRGDDGIPGWAQNFDALRPATAPLVVRTFDDGGSRAARDEQLASMSPLLAVLGTINDTPRMWVAAGQALQRVLLEATVLGVSASFLNQPVEVPGLRDSVGRLTGRPGFAQLLLRLGYGPTVPATPRRRPEAVVLKH